MIQDVLYLYHSKGNPRNSEGAFVEIPGKKIMFIYTCYVGNSWRDHATADLAVRESYDNGKNWTDEDRIIFDHNKIGAENIMSVSLVRLAAGRIVLLAVVKRPSATDFGLDGGMACLPYTSFSDDDGETWSELKPVMDKEGYIVVANDRMTELSDGRLVIPFATHESNVSFLYSSDQGNSWQQKPVWLKCTEASGFHFQEPGIVELADGTFFSYFRTKSGKQYGAFSSDGGDSWSVPEALNDFCSPEAPMNIKRNPVNGNLTAIWDDHADRWDLPVPEYTRPGWGDVPTGGRHPLVIAESSDEGKTWHNPRRVEKDPRRGYCYAAMHFTKDALLLAYCCGGLNNTIMLQDLKLVRISLAGDGSLEFEGV